MINFQNVKFKNFGSFGNYFTEIDFTKNNMTLVSGSNGHGKSYALLDSVTFALFGKPFRKINIPQLVNSVNKKDCLVEVTFSIGSDFYKVLRGLKPKKFEIYKNDELVKQSAKSKDYQKILEDQILKMNYKSFTQIVTLGSSSFVPFMQLTPADRREVIEDILDISIFSSMNLIMKAKASNIKEKIRSGNLEIETIKEKIKIQENNIKSLINKKNESIKNNISKIKDIEEKVLLLLEEIDELDSTSDNMDEIELLKNSIQKNIAKQEESTVTLIKVKKTLVESLSFYNENESCPVCSQSLTKEFKENKLSSIQDDLSKLEKKIQQNVSTFTKNKKELELVKEKIKKIKDTQIFISEKKSSVSAAKKYIENLQEEISLKDSFDQAITESELEKEKHESELNVKFTKLDKIKNLKSNLDVLSILLKDSGIKTKIVNNYLPAINEIINKYLNKMSFFVSFSLDEQFNEEIKSRHRDTFSYMNFSEGEKSRIDLSILLAWREIAKLKNSSHCNLLILDEIFDSSLDAVGVEDLMKVLKDLSINSNVFVITHKSDQLSDKFNKTINFYKKNNFSRIK